MDIPLYSWSNDIYHISTSLKIKPRSTSAPRCPTFSLNVPPFWHLAKILRVCGHRHFASADLTSLEKNRFGTPQNAMVLDPKIGWLNEYFTGFMFAFEPTPLCWGPSWGVLNLGTQKHRWDFTCCCVISRSGICRISRSLGKTRFGVSQNCVTPNHWGPPLKITKTLDDNLGFPPC